MNPSLSFASVVSLFGSLGMIASLLLVGVLAYAITRTRSTHIVMFRLWRLASGGAELHDEKIRTYLHDQHALMSFRFVTGLAVHRTEDVHALIDWSRERQIDIEQLGRAGEYFDPASKTVSADKLPGKRRLVGMLVSATLSWLLFLLTMLTLAFFFDQALVRFKSSGTQFALRPDSARMLWPFSDRYRLIDCSSNTTAKEAGFTPEEQAILCTSFRDPQARRYVTETIQEQRAGLAMLLLALLVATVLNSRAIQRVHAAKKLAGTLEQPYLKQEVETRSLGTTDDPPSVAVPHT